MSESLVEDMLDRAVRAAGRTKKQPDWHAQDLRSPEWDKFSVAMVKVLDEARGHGLGKPLAKLQELAFECALVQVTNKPLQSVSLWLTDSRIWMERYTGTKDAEAARLLERRGLLRPKDGAP